MDVVGGFAVLVDLVGFFVDLLVVFDVGVDRGAVVPRGHVEALFQLNAAYRVDPDGHVGTVVADGWILGDEVELGGLDSVYYLIAKVRDCPCGCEIFAAAAEAYGEEGFNLGLVVCRVDNGEVIGGGIEHAQNAVAEFNEAEGG